MKTKIKFKTGCSGFYNRHWKEIFYPEKMPQREWLNYYSEKLNSLELNMTFYHFPDAARLQTFHDKTPAGFIFSVKAPRIITHLKKFNDCARFIDDFYAACENGLKKKLGCILFQLPPGIHYSEEKLEQIIGLLKPGYKNVLEFRHPSWWQPSVYDKLKKHKIIFCSISHPALPDILILNMPTAYIRLHGKTQLFYSNYSNKELEELYQSLMANEKLKEAFVYFNNTAGTAGILNALHFQELTK